MYFTRSQNSNGLAHCSKYVNGPFLFMLSSVGINCNYGNVDSIKDVQILELSWKNIHHVNIVIVVYRILPILCLY